MEGESPKERIRRLIDEATSQRPGTKEQIPTVQVHGNNNSTITAGGNVYMGPRGLWDLPTDELLHRRKARVDQFRRNRILYWANGYSASLVILSVSVLWMALFRRDLIASVGEPYWLPLAAGLIAVGTPSILLGRYRQRLDGENHHHIEAIKAIDEVLHRRA